ncbi:armadillo (ARM) repeat-containing protein family [Trichomonas vaginalis G3]|uniref:armadillo (ARM) repeat-containing protein family n=1 Tax=Trichomonas vaginalis (strain ATCC PRA-98 / G3) TaxID=412133 RepID=UPI0021E60CA0|nr:armadillo (ARM) repeat-containing protein family [Trichomonas vaginalis G3]KAI5490723.1 armadillo (ARM) repeat-containing protein family [Trichomonas vaginalis G3]
MTDLSLEIIRHAIASSKENNTQVQEENRIIHDKWTSFPQNIKYCIQLLQEPQSHLEIFYAALATKKLLQYYNAIMSPETIEMLFNLLNFHAQELDMSEKREDRSTFNFVIDALAMICISHTELIQNINLSQDKLIKFYISVADIFDPEFMNDTDYFTDKIFEVLCEVEPSYDWCELFSKYSNKFSNDFPSNFLTNLEVVSQDLNNLKSLIDISYDYFQEFDDLKEPYITCLINMINNKLAQTDNDSTTISFIFSCLKTVIDLDAEFYIAHPDFAIQTFDQVLNITEQLIENTDEIFFILEWTKDVFTFQPDDEQNVFLSLIPRMLIIIIHIANNLSYEELSSANQFINLIDAMSESKYFIPYWQELITELTPGNILIISCLNQRCRPEISKAVIQPLLSAGIIPFGSRFIVECFVFFPPELSDQCIQYVLDSFQEDPSLLNAEYLEKLSLLAADIFAQNLPLIDNFVSLDDQATAELVPYFYLIIIMPMMKVTDQETIKSYSTSALQIVTQKFAQRLEKKKLPKAFKFILDMIQHYVDFFHENNREPIIEDTIAQKGITYGDMKYFVRPNLEICIRSMLDELGDILYTDDIDIQGDIMQIIAAASDAELLSVELVLEWAAAAFENCPSQYIYSILDRGGDAVTSNSKIFRSLTPEYMQPFLQYIPQLQNEEAAKQAFTWIYNCLRITSFNVLDLVDTDFFSNCLSLPLTYAMPYLMDTINSVLDPSVVQARGLQMWISPIVESLIEHIVKDYTGNTLEIAIEKLFNCVKWEYIPPERLKYIVLFNETDESIINDFNEYLRWLISEVIDKNPIYLTHIVIGFSKLSAVIILRNREKNN